jgi:hypothetical protein
VAREVLVELPCPTVGLGEGLLAPTAEALVAGFDTVVARRADLERIGDTVYAQPLA